MLGARGTKPRGGGVDVWLSLTLGLGLVLSGCSTRVVIPPVAGVVWQIDSKTLDPRGVWHEMGATELLVQWTAVDDVAFVENTLTTMPTSTTMPMTMTTASERPAWSRIAAEPWAQDVILGLAGRFNEAQARDDIENLAAESETLAKLPTPLHVVGWYFPVEIDPTWSKAPSLAPLLARLPRPLWISVYDSANVGPDTLVEGLMTWLPADVGVFFQDGVGVYAREARTARHYADVLSARLGSNRVRIIAEAFRPRVGGGFRSATIAELGPQLATYAGYRIYLFEGPHYVPDSLVAEIRRRQTSPER
ncbi:MAG: hypothetical protein ABI672_14700 [Vicinamibacteria bacterium]